MEPQQLDAVLADWRDATEPLDGKSSVDPSFFASSSSSSSTWLLSSSLSSSSAAAKASRALTRALEQRDERHCRPWSHADFLARISSFSIGTWFAKPESISVFACARHGWSHTGEPDQLYCPWTAEC
uniref:C3HC-type domain-containing protein n=1 Tax=Globisporangium ultimum (strain ATCC 200006 / CBS 805.95 / DAOM BR144) TaxID=431595 RepID=K3WFL6_GLOUD